MRVAARPERLGDGELAHHVDLQLPADVKREQLRGAGEADPGVVDQAVQARGGGVLGHGASRGGDLAGVGDVEDERGELATRGRAGELFAVGVVPDPGVDVLAGRREA